MNKIDQGVFIVTVSSYYLRDSQVFVPDETVNLDPESDEMDDSYEDDDNWRDSEFDGYLGVYTWARNDEDGLLNYVAKKHGLRKETLVAFNILDFHDVKSVVVAKK